jgi:hypothetical protein
VKLVEVSQTKRIEGEEYLKTKNYELKTSKKIKKLSAVAYREGGLGVKPPPPQQKKNSEVLTKLSRIPCSVENTSVTV